MATHSSILAWRIPGTGEPGGLPPMGSHRVRHDWSDLAAAAAAALGYCCCLFPFSIKGGEKKATKTKLCFSWCFSINYSKNSYMRSCNASPSLSQTIHVHATLPYWKNRIAVSCYSKTHHQGWWTYIWDKYWRDLKLENRSKSTKGKQQYYTSWRLVGTSLVLVSLILSLSFCIWKLQGSLLKHTMLWLMDWQVY